MIRAFASISEDNFHYVAPGVAAGQPAKPRGGFTFPATSDGAGRFFALEEARKMLYCSFRRYFVTIRNHYRMQYLSGFPFAGVSGGQVRAKSHAESLVDRKPVFLRGAATLRLAQCGAAQF
jgi:hypothetical protein